MKIIDRKTGTRVGAEKKKQLKDLSKKDPVKANVEKGLEDEEFSPMDPPDAYSDTHTVGELDESQLPEYLKSLMQEHKEVNGNIEKFEKSLLEFKESGYSFTQEINQSFGTFFGYFDEHIMEHNRKEESKFFPLLHQRLIENGEKGEDNKTAIDLMEDDHVKFIQLAGLAFNIFGLASRLPDERSRMLTFDVAFNTAQELIELLKLHIFREDKTLFPLAVELISAEEFKSFEEN